MRVFRRLNALLLVLSACAALAASPPAAPFSAEAVVEAIGYGKLADAVYHPNEAGAASVGAWGRKAYSGAPSATVFALMLTGDAGEGAICGRRDLVAKICDCHPDRRHDEN